MEVSLREETLRQWRTGETLGVLIGSIILDPEQMTNSRIVLLGGGEVAKHKSINLNSSFF